MVISIRDDRSIGEIQEDFQKDFPSLKIEFFSQPHQGGEATPYSLRIGSETKLGSLRNLHNNGYLTISPDMSAGELEEHLRDFYGLFAQVFRKQGDEWIETTKTDEWPLSRHESMAQETMLQHKASRQSTIENTENDMREQM